MVEGRARLREWLQRSRLTQRAGAQLLGVHYTFLNQILNDERNPALATAVRIERLTGIPVETWMPTEVDVRLIGAGAKGGKRKIYRT